MTAPDLAAIEARLAAATPGPWRTGGDESDRLRGDVSVRATMRNGRTFGILNCPDCGVWAGAEEPDAELIAHAPTDIAALLARVKELEADRNRAQPVLDALSVWRYMEDEIGTPDGQQAEDQLIEAFDTWTST